MKLAFVCSGRPDNLKYLTNNRTMVDELLTQHGWKVIQTPLYSIADLNRRLQEYQNSNIDEFLFFYTGHGDVSNRQQILKLQLDNTEISLNDVLDSIFKYINPKKQAIVLDACYSGTLKDLTLENNTEFLFSSQAREQSYEDDGLEASVFSFYFCEAVGNGCVKLEEISDYIASKDKRQEPLPLSVGSEKIIIGFKNNIEKSYLNEKKILQNNPLFKKLKKVDNKELLVSKRIEQQFIDILKFLENSSSLSFYDINHNLKVLEIIGKILPIEKINLNIVELQILIYAVLFHDIGMIVTQLEVKTLKQSNEFSESTIEYGQEIEDDEILVELVRKTNIKRAINYINKTKNKLKYSQKDISSFIKKIIKSIELPIEELKNKNIFPTDKLISDKRVNIQFLTILLKLGDVLTLDITRIPYSLFKFLEIKNQKHLLSLDRHIVLDGDDIQQDFLEYQITCSNIEAHRKIEEYFKWLDKEREEAMTLLKDEKQDNYYLDIKDKIQSKIERNGYEYSSLELHLDYEKVLNILMGTNLYDSVDIFLRELLQNSYDACKYRRELEEREDEDYSPKVTIKYSSESQILEIIDNGIGIDEDVFKNYVISIGKSYYKSKSFSNDNTKFLPVSNFGIGIISCFMISDTIEIESKKYYKEAIHYILNVEDKYIEKKKTTRERIGTSIKLKLHDDYIEKLKEKPIEEIIDENMAYQPIPIVLKIDNQDKIILNQKKIELPEHHELSQSSQFIEFGEDEELEGYIILQTNGEQNLFGSTKISQQYFTITGKGTNINLAPSWLRHTVFNINIPDKYKIQLKASRTKIETEDKHLQIVKDIILEKIIKKFKKLEKTSGINSFFKYADDGRGRSKQYGEKEYNFLINLPIFVISKIKNTFETKWINSTFNNFKINLTKKKEKIAVIRSEYMNQVHVFQYLKQNDYDYFVLDRIGDIHYFYQLIQPLVEKNSVMVSDEIEGLTFNSLILKENKKISHLNYVEKYSWSDVTEQITQNYFVLISNNNYNGFGTIIFNKEHKLGKLLEKYKKNIYVQGFQNSVENNFKKVLFHDSKLLNIFNWDIQKNYFFAESDNRKSYALKFVRCLKNGFLNSMNQVLKDKVLTKLVEDDLLKEDELKDYLLTKNDFPHWYFVDNI